ncbi:FkbM family methyltransferase [Candidatus Parcubacteria bacterium]|nr:FkbM family methyltransferase [Patescibacteria group bacterium]MBU4309249.1 FkbM family methyltransferase [Patescibacteria group bacterium]MBU4432478.1 FkbM family methyltransferase [Patescibacteria group bacterium]MBU4577610.1 FkbM family methyltransferase [Patescibacteria group bacterium]MCG2697297.1 FkbM family methyltransferase [Candidatus Parcubacteria bacterium]
MKNYLVSLMKKIIIGLFNSLKKRGKISSILTGELRGHKWDYFSSAPSFYFGSFEKKKVKLFISSVVDAKVVFDIGSNVGYYSLLANKYMKEGKVFAFEPSRRNVEFLKKHMSLNNADKVEVVDSAISDVSGEVFLQENELGVLDTISSKEGTYNVSAISIDDFCESKNLYPDVIKLDVEGAEMLAFNGAKKTLASKRPVVFLSTHSDELEVQCKAFLEGLGYSLTLIEPTEYLAKC